MSETPRAAGHRIEIEYCTQCNWLHRAVWVAQELLTTFATDLGEVALVPGTGGVFIVRLDGEPVFDRRDTDAFLDPRALKQALRDRIDPERSLGHVDRRHTDRRQAPEHPNDRAQ